MFHDVLCEFCLRNDYTQPSRADWLDITAALRESGIVKAVKMLRQVCYKVEVVEPIIPDTVRQYDGKESVFTDFVLATCTRIVRDPLPLRDALDMLRWYEAYPEMELPECS